MAVCAGFMHALCALWSIKSVLWWSKQRPSSASCQIRRSSFSTTGLCRSCRCIKLVCRHWSWLHTRRLFRGNLRKHELREQLCIFSCGRRPNGNMEVVYAPLHKGSHVRRASLTRRVCVRFVLDGGGQWTATLCGRSPLTSRTRSFWGCDVSAGGMVRSGVQGRPAGFVWVVFGVLQSFLQCICGCSVG